jgi:hypothetical protein
MAGREEDDRTLTRRTLDRRSLDRSLDRRARLVSTSSLPPSLASLPACPLDGDSIPIPHDGS